MVNSSVGTFIMALIYLISVSIQLYQMRINFIPVLGVSQIFLMIKNGHSEVVNHIKLHNMSGGAAKEINIFNEYNNEEIYELQFM